MKQKLDKLKNEVKANINFRHLTREILKDYQRIKFRLNNIQALEHVSLVYVKNKELKEIDKKLVVLVEEVFKLLPEDHTQIMKNFFLENKNYSDMSYSPSQFYRKLEKACKGFCSFIVC